MVASVSGSPGLGWAQCLSECPSLSGVSLSAPRPDLLLGTPPVPVRLADLGPRGTVSVSVPGQFLREVDPGLPADKAGMQAGDRLVAVAGESVEGLGHEETVSRIRAQGSRVALTVVDPEADRFFRMVRGAGPGAQPEGRGGRRRQVCPRCLQVRLSPLLFLESAEAPASPQSTRPAPGADTEDPPGEDTALPPAPRGSRQCCLFPGPGGGYGFRLSYVASGPRLSIAQVTGAPGPSLPAHRRGCLPGPERPRIPTGSLSRVSPASR